MSVPSDKKTALITGCSPGGIGNSLAREFHRRGFHVFATARNPAVLDDLAALGMTPVALDVTKPESIEAAKNAVSDLTGGRLDVLVNNAGTTYVMPLPDADISAVRALFEANVFGVMATTSAFLPLLIASSSTSPSSSLPTIVLISSQADRSPFPFKGSYAMSKAALSAYGRTLAVELDALGVRVLTVITGYVTSHMGRGSSGAPVQPTLPQGSLFDAMKDALVPNVAGKRMSADEYARRVVGEVAKGKGWAWGGWGGTREWIWAGGKTTAVWFLALWPEAVLKAVVLRRWPFWMLRQAREKKRV